MNKKFTNKYLKEAVEALADQIEGNVFRKFTSEQAEAIVKVGLAKNDPGKAWVITEKGKKLINWK